MKTANVVEVRDLGALTPLDPGTDPDQARMDRMAELLRRYPDIPSEEEAELIQFLKYGRQLEIGLVSAREGVAPRMMRFRRDHARDFRLTPIQGLGFAALILVPLLALAWACFG